jgi:hypothetical protein
MKNLRKRYRDLEMEIHSELRQLVNKSEYYSRHIDMRAIKLPPTNSFDEVTIVYDSLVLINDNGQHYTLNHLSLEELIDIIQPIK